MKRLLLAVAAGAMALTGTMASAQPYGYRAPQQGDYQQWNRDRYDRERHHRQEYDRRRDAYVYGYGQREAPRGYWGSRPYYNNYGGYGVGQRYPYYNNNRYVIYDYNAYHLPPPRPGYRYYRDDSGSIIMAAIASGLIGMIIGDALNDGR